MKLLSAFRTAFPASNQSSVFLSVTMWSYDRVCRKLRGQIEICTIYKRKKGSRMNRWCTNIDTAIHNTILYLRPTSTTLILWLDQLLDKSRNTSPDNISWYRITDSQIDFHRIWLYFWVVPNVIVQKDWSKQQNSILYQYHTTFIRQMYHIHTRAIPVVPERYQWYRHRLSRRGRPSEPHWGPPFQWCTMTVRRHFLHNFTHALQDARMLPW